MQIAKQKERKLIFVAKLYKSHGKRVENSVYYDDAFCFYKLKTLNFKIFKVDAPSSEKFQVPKKFNFIYFFNV